LLYRVFFFEAENGLRGFHVTGVQTCALPISNEIGVRAALGTLYPELEQEVRISNLSRPLFVYFKPNIANNFDTQSPLGISIYAKIGRASCRERGNTSMAAQTRPEPTENTHRW